MKHEIFGLGVVLLELQCGASFDSHPDAQYWEWLNGERLRKEFLKCAIDNKSGQLGEVFTDPIIQCLSGFEEVDCGVDATCQPQILGAFRRHILDPLT